MRGEFFDFDPVTGLLETYEEVDGNILIHTYQDVEPILDAAKRIANSGTSDAAWTKHEAAIYAVIPQIVQGQMLKKGINFMDPNDVGKVVREINENYAYLKTTYKHHEVR
jgi:hypothetical protein